MSRIWQIENVHKLENTAHFDQVIFVSLALVPVQIFVKSESSMISHVGRRDKQMTMTM